MGIDRFFDFSARSIHKDRPLRESERFKADPKERSPEFNSFLAKVKFPVLRDVFAEHAKHAGIIPKELNVLDGSRIYEGIIGVDESSDFLGGYSLEKNTIEIAKADRFEKIKQPELLNLLRLYSLVHEEGHAVGRGERAGLPEYTDKGNEWYRRPFRRWESRLGYEHTKYDSRGYDQFFNGLNEGVTDSLAREVYWDYLDRDPDFATKEDINRFINDENVAFCLNSYNLPVQMVDALIERISKDTGVPDDIVWGGFKRGLFEGVNMDSSEMRNAFGEIFSKGFLERMSNATSWIDYRLLISEIGGRTENEGGQKFWNKIRFYFNI